jgi:hypothetical protein
MEGLEALPKLPIHKKAPGSEKVEINAGCCRTAVRQNSMAAVISRPAVP